jgi:myo-inositol-1(or 4)-monophosphatase
MAEPVSTSPKEDLELLRSAVVGAGIIAAGFFRRDIKTWTKDNASPVSEADIIVDKFLRATLMGARPDYGWLSEESIDDPSRLGKKRCFIVDPIDGTRGFLRGENGRPIAGTVFAPSRDELYEACLGGGSRLNGKPLLRVTQPGHGPVIPAPGAVHAELQAAGLEYVRGPYMPSLAYRLIQVATGTLDAAVARRGSQDWDIASAAIILSEAGIQFEDVCDGPLLFNRPDVRHGALAALSDKSLKPLVHAALIRVYGCPGLVENADLERLTP